MNRTGGWTATVQRPTAHVPHSHRNPLTFLAGLRHDGLFSPFVLDRPINGEMPTAWTGQGLLPLLTPGITVIAENLGREKKGSPPTNGSAIPIHTASKPHGAGWHPGAMNSSKPGARTTSATQSMLQCVSDSP